LQALEARHDEEIAQWRTQCITVSFTVLEPNEETVFDEIKRYVRFTDADARILAGLRPHLRPHFERIVGDFYDRIREHELAHEVLTDEAQVERLKGSLARWLDRICAGPYDQAYYEETAKIGRIHVRVGLPQHYMFTAMALVRLSLLGVAEAALGIEASRPARDALNRVLDLELAIMLGSYRDDYVARIQRRDRLEREEVGRTLARTQHRYQQAVELTRVLFVGLDARAEVRLYNREAERVTGFDRGDVLGTRFADLLPEGLRYEHGPLVERAALGLPSTPDQLESAVRTRSGKVRDVRWRLTYAPTEVDDEIVLFAVGQDTTDENALAARMRQSEKLAAVGTLAAGLAHEIRNPLNGARLHLTFLDRGLRRAGVDDADALEAVRVVGEEIHRLEELVNEFLDFARPRPLEKKVCSLRAICERAVQLLAPVARTGGVVLQLDFPASDLDIEIDGPKVEQVLLNVLQNGIESTTSAGGGSVTLRVRRQPRRALLEIEDDGPGLPSPDAPIFDAFYSTKPHGTGLGLPIAHRIVTDHGGVIDVSSRPGSTLFRLTLPLQLT
jgi:PAS domain S-box-containing protein